MLCLLEYSYLSYQLESQILPISRSYTQHSKQTTNLLYVIDSFCGLRIEFGICFEVFYKYVQNVLGKTTCLRLLP